VTTALNGFRECECCGKRFYIESLQDYVYKRTVQRKNTMVNLWFCSWTCLRRWEKERKKR